MPKFKLEETVELVQILARLGATDMFREPIDPPLDGDADFSNINGQRNLV